MKLARAAVVGLLAAVAVSCAAPVVGTPGPTSLPPGTPPLPPRPRELRIDGLDPCTTLTPAQLKVLGVGLYGPNSPDDTHGPSCDWIHSPNEPIESYTVGRNSGFRLEELFGNPRGATVATVAGFPAVVTQGLYAPREKSCNVIVGVAHLREIETDYFYNGLTVPMTRELACEKAKTAAEMAMQTILARGGG